MEPCSLLVAAVNFLPDGAASNCIQRFDAPKKGTQDINKDMI